MHTQLLTLAELVQTCGMALATDPERTSAQTEILLEAAYHPLDLRRSAGTLEAEAHEVHTYSLIDEESAEEAYAAELALTNGQTWSSRGASNDTRCSRKTRPCSPCGPSRCPSCKTGQHPSSRPLLFLRPSLHLRQPQPEAEVVAVARPEAGLHGAVPVDESCGAIAEDAKNSCFVSLACLWEEGQLQKRQESSGDWIR